MEHHNIYTTEYSFTNTASYTTKKRQFDVYDPVGIRSGKGEGRTGKVVALKGSNTEGMPLVEVLLDNGDTITTREDNLNGYLRGNEKVKNVTNKRVTDDDIKAFQPIHRDESEFDPMPSFEDWMNEQEEATSRLPHLDTERLDKVVDTSVVRRRLPKLRTGN